jgi:hypothetical protein
MGVGRSVGREARSDQCVVACVPVAPRRVPGRAADRRLLVNPVPGRPVVQSGRRPYSATRVASAGRAPVSQSEEEGRNEA